eukprot:UN01786
MSNLIYAIYMRFYNSIDAAEQADGNLILDEKLKFLSSSRICLLTFGLIVFYCTKFQRFVFSVYFALLAFLLRSSKMIWAIGSFILTSMN